jgi:periplasmic divalent cation tolerance protein
MSDALVIFCACPDDGVAAALARRLVDERLAACVNRWPLTASTYRWDGHVVDEPEVMLMIKTTPDRYPALAARLVELHPYEVPEVIALPVEHGHPAYLRWLGAETSG